MQSWQPLIYKLDEPHHLLSHNHHRNNRTRELENLPEQDQWDLFPQILWMKFQPQTVSVGKDNSCKGGRGTQWSTGKRGKCRGAQRSRGGSHEIPAGRGPLCPPWLASFRSTPTGVATPSPALGASKVQLLFSQSHVWLFCDPMDCSLPGSSVH